MDIERELARISGKLDSAVKADEAYNALLRAGGMSRQHVISLESIQPGILTDLQLPGGFTQELSARHYTVSLEQATILRRVLFTAAFGALLYFFIKLLGKTGLFGPFEGGGGGGGSGGGSNYERRKNDIKDKQKKSEEKLAAKLQKLKESIGIRDDAFRAAITDDVYKFLEEIGVDATVIDSIRNSSSKAHSYFMDFDNENSSQFMRDAFVHWLNSHTFIIMTSPNFKEFQKNAAVIAAVINEHRESRVLKLLRICQDTDHVLPILREQVKSRTFTGQFDASRYGDNADNDPDDIHAVRKLMKWPETKTARAVASEIRNLFSSYLQSASDEQQKYYFKSKKDFEDRCTPELFSIIGLCEDYGKFLVEDGKSLYEELQHTGKKIDDMRSEMQAEIDDMRSSGRYDGVSESSPTTLLWQNLMIVKELDRIGHYIRSHMFATDDLMGAMASLASVARMIYGVYAHGYKSDEKAVFVVDKIQAAFNAANATLEK